MKMIALVTILHFGGGWVLYPPYSNAQQMISEEPSAAIKSCVAAYAPDVERTIDSLSEGTEFLVHKICGGPIADQLAEVNGKASEAQKARMDELCKQQAQQPAASAAPTGGGDDFDYMAQMCRYRGMYDDTLAGVSVVGVYGPYGAANVAAPKATSLAAQTLLQLRIQRVGKKR